MHITLLVSQLPLHTPPHFIFILGGRLLWTPLADMRDTYLTTGPRVSRVAERGGKNNLSRQPLVQGTLREATSLTQRQHSVPVGAAPGRAHCRNGAGAESLPAPQPRPGRRVKPQGLCLSLVLLLTVRVWGVLKAVKRRPNSQ